MTKISEERMNRFWQWCGVDTAHQWMPHASYSAREGSYCCKCGHDREKKPKYCLPVFDFKNFDKHVLSKVLRNWQLEIKVALQGFVSVTLSECTNEIVRRQIFVIANDIAAALVLAIDKVREIEEEEGDDREKD